MSWLGFGLLALVTLASALVVVVKRNLFHAVLAFAITSLGIAGFMLTLRAEFLALVVILVYIGAVVVMGVFAVMLTGKFEESPIPTSNELVSTAVVVVLALVGLVIGVILIQPQPGGRLGTPLSLERLGQLLLTDYVLPFELVSILLLAALIGAIVIAKGKERQP